MAQQSGSLQKKKKSSPEKMQHSGFLQNYLAGGHRQDLFSTNFFFLLAGSLKYIEIVPPHFSSDLFLRKALK